MTPEFRLIERYFTRPTPSATLGVGDDATLLPIGSGMELAVSGDMLVVGTHFFHDANPCQLGWKTLAVNLSDLAAMGAKPRWAMLAIALPQTDDVWLAAFADGLFKCAEHFDVELVGGDTTRGPLNLCMTVLGEVPAGQALRRDAARSGDDIWLSGPLGGAALALAAHKRGVPLSEAEFAHCRRCLDTPQPRVALGLALRGIAHAAIDISDGLLADLGHILERSQLGAEIHFTKLPAHPALAPLLDAPWARDCLLAGGDDYELCFTAAPKQASAIRAIGKRLGLLLTCIGRITTERQLRLLDEAGCAMEYSKTGYDHFA